MPDNVFTAIFKTRPARFLIDTGSLRSFIGKAFLGHFPRVKTKRLADGTHHYSLAGRSTTTTHSVHGGIRTEFGNFGRITFEVAAKPPTVDGIIGSYTLESHPSLHVAYMAYWKEKALGIKTVTTPGVELEGTGHGMWQDELVGALNEEGAEEDVLEELLDHQMDRINADLLEEFGDLFADKLPDSIPDITKETVFHEVKQVKPDVRHKSAYYAIPHQLDPTARKMVEDNVRAGRWVASDSPCSSGWFIKPKKDPNATPRSLIDYRRLNSNTVKDATCIPKTDDVLHMINQASSGERLT